MGDGADRYTEEGIDELQAHRDGECEGPCQYCAEEDKAARARIAARVNKPKKRREHNADARTTD